MNFTYRCKHEKICNVTIKRPIVPIKLYGKDGLSLNFNAILDSGSDFVLLPLEVAEELGLEYDQNNCAPASTYEGSTFTTTKSAVYVTIQKGREQSIKFSVKCMINLSHEKDYGDIILGSTFFENFKINFDYSNNKFQIKK